jgi:hypothetical protein
MKDNNNNMTIRLEPRTVFGNQLYYPSCEASRLILKLMNQKSFTPQQVERMDKSDCMDILEVAFSRIL